MGYDELFLKEIPEEYHKYFTTGTRYDIIIENVVKDQQKIIEELRSEIAALEDEFYENP